jgi:hypothetical protein
MESTTEAVCTCCRKDKPLSEFHADERRGNGRTAQCRECRGALANSRRYPVACLECRRHRRLNPNGCCVRCNVARGLRYCTVCRVMLPALLSFYRERAVCKDCLKRRRETLKSENQ